LNCLVWSGKSSIHDRSWGKETTWPISKGRYCKIINLDKQSKILMNSSETRKNVLYLLQGAITVNHLDEENFETDQIAVTPGSFVTIEHGQKCSIVPYVDSVIIAVSDYVANFEDLDAQE